MKQQEEMEVPASQRKATRGTRDHVLIHQNEERKIPCKACLKMKEKLGNGILLGQKEHIN